MSKKQTSFIARSLFDLALLLSAFLMPWWVTIALVIIIFFYFDSYVEYVVVFGLVGFLYFNVPNHLFIFSLIPLVALGSFIVGEWFKRRLLRRRIY